MQFVPIFYLNSKTYYFVANVHERIRIRRSDFAWKMNDNEGSVRETAESSIV